MTSSISNRSPHSKPHASRLARGGIAPWLIASVILAALSLVHSSMPTGFDPSAWVTWANSAAHGEFILFRIEPGWKPLPVIAMTPAAMLSEHLAGALWLVTVRACALLTPVLVFRLIKPTFGGWAAGIAAAGVASIPGLWVTALGGHSEPAAVAAALGAAECLRRERPRAAIILIATFALMRPEAILLLGIVATYAAVNRKWSWVALVAGCAAMFAACWYGLPWLLADDPWQVHRLSPITPPFRNAFSPLEKLTMPLSAGLWPLHLAGIGLAGLGTIGVARSRDRLLKGVVAAAIGFAIIEVAVLLSGAAGAPRYFLPATILGSSLIGPGAMLLIGRLRSASARNAAAIAAMFVLVATGPLPPGSPLRNRALVIPSADDARNLDRAASLLISSRVLERPAACGPIGVSYGTWPMIASRTGQPMSRFDYTVRAPVVTLEHIDAAGKRNPDQMHMIGDPGDRRVLAASEDPTGGGRWIVASWGAAKPCG